MIRFSPSAFTAVAARGNRRLSCLGILLSLIASLTAAQEPTSVVPLVTVGAAASSDTGPQLPSKESIERRRAEIEADKSIEEPVKKELLALLDDTLQKSVEIGQSTERLAALKQAARAAPEATAAAEKALKEAQNAQIPELDFFGSPDELQAAKLMADQAVAEARQLREELESARNTREERMSSVAKLLADTREQLNAKMQSLAKPNEAESLPVGTQAKQWNQMASVALLQQQSAVFQQEKTTFELERPLLDLRIKLAKLEEQRLQDRARELAQRFAEDRVIKTRKRISEFEEEIAKTQLADHELTEDTREIAKQWQALIQGQVDVESALSELSTKAFNLTQEYEAISGQVKKELQNGSGLSSAMGLMLQQKRAALPNLAALRRQLALTNGEIDRVRSLQTSIGLLRESIMRNMSSRNRSGTTSDTGYKLLESLLERIEADAETYRNLLISKSIEQQQYIESIVNFATMIDGHVLWFRSAERIGWDDFAFAWRAFQGLVYPPNLRDVGVALFVEGRDNFILTTAWFTLILLLIFGGPRLRRRLQRLGNEAGRGTSTRMQPTWAAILSTAILTLLLPLVLIVPGWRLAYSDSYSTFVEATGFGMLFAGLFVAPLELIRQVVRPGGLAIAHFGWSERAATALRLHMRWYIDLGLPFVLVLSMLTHSGNVRWESSLGRMVFVAFMLLTAWFLRGVLHPQTGALSFWLQKHRDGWVDRLRVVWHPVLFCTPLLLAFLSLLGYSYSAYKLTDQLYKSLMLAVALILVGGLLRRWAMLNRRALALQQIRERAAAADAPDRSPIEVGEPQELNVREANEQTMRLIATTLTVAGLFGFAWIWTSVLPAIDYLNRFVIIPASANSDDPFTLGDIVIVAPLIALTFIAVRNLPGLLETTLLQRLPLDNAARYAIKTISSYVMLFAGIMLAASTIGVRWESIQWLVAALGVGLGFGLQEIFANFISGIILLFEQPLRVGDVVTLDGTTGVVSRIRMRATTVTNWDRQELIIPNKDLITGRLVNWTLSDTTNRLVIEVGVAYGTNTDQACEVLMNICREHPNVADEPEPVITFEGFGDSTLNLVIRCYLASLDNRLMTIHQLHTNIHNRFNAEGIEISFPQRDLHLRSFPKELLDLRPSA
ncbi:MAG: mechanosensitive ion channel [Pirellulaceae bacterium]